MSEPADSTGEATGATFADAKVADSTPTGQEQGDQSAEKRINGLMSLAQRRTAERDAALTELATLKAQLVERETEAAGDGDQQLTQMQAMYPERYATEEVAQVDDVDPMAPPEPPTIVMGVNPARGQSVPFGDAPPVIGDMSNPSVRYASDQAEIAVLRRQLNAAGAAWVDQARESGLMD